MFAELRRRNVHRVAIAYLAGAWLLVQIIETLMPAFDWSGQVLRLVLVVLAIGFIPALIIAWVFEWTPGGFRREAALSSDDQRADPRVFDRVITVVLVLAVAYFAVDKFVFDPARDEVAIQAAEEQAVRRALSGSFIENFKDRSVLLVPFLNMSSDPEQEYFADGISEELLNVLARIEDIRVISRSTSWTFKGKEVDVADVQRKLGVSHILEGSVRKAGNQVRITAQLIDARTDTHVWSDTYDRSFDDIFAIQDEISVAVADEMHLELFQAPSPHEGIDPRAYELFLQSGAGALAAAPDDPVRMGRLLEQALELEPDYLPALYYLAITIEQRPRQELVDDEAEMRQTIMGLVDRMEELAPDGVYASNWRAYMAMNWDNDLVAAAPHLEKSMRFANRTDIHVWVNGAMLLLNDLGRYDEAVVLGQYTTSRDPACNYCLRRLAQAMRAAGLTKDAATVIESQLQWREMDAYGYWSLGVAFLAAGDADKALHYFELIDERDEQITRDFARAFALYSLGRVEEFEAILASELERGSPEGIARLYAWSNQPDKAFEWLENMVEVQGEDSARLVKTELYEPIKSDPRWQPFLEKYNAEDRKLIGVRFEPNYPPALQRAMDALPGQH